MQLTGPNPLEFLLVLLLGGGFGSSGVPTQEDPLMGKAAPEECLVYSSWAGTEAPDAESGNHTEQMLAEPEIQKFLEQRGSLLLDTMQGPLAQDAEQREAFNDVRELLELIRGKPGTFFLSEVRIPDDGPPEIYGGGMLRAGEDAAELKALLEKFQSNVPEENVTSVKLADRTFSCVQLQALDNAPVVWAVLGKYLLVAVGDGSAEALVERVRGTAPDWLVETQTKLATSRPSSLLYANVKQLVQLGVQASGEPEADRVLSVLGLDGIESFAMASGLDDTGSVTRALLTVDGPGRGLMSWIDAKPLTAGDLEIIPREAPAAVSFKLNPTAVLDLWLDLAGQLDPNDAENISQGLAQIEQQFDIAVREDVLNSLGDMWRIFAQPGPRGLLTGWTAAIGVRDRQRLEQAQEKLVALAKGAFQQAGADAPSIQSTTKNGYTVYTINFSAPGIPIAPSWCVTDEELLITATPGALAPLLRDRPGESLAALPEVQPLIDEDSRTLAIVYADMQEVTTTLLPLATLALEGLADQPGAPPLDTSNLPPADVLRHLQPAVIALQRTEDGVEFSSHHTMPGGNLGASAPVAVALLLPAVQSAREAARRMQSQNNLKQIALAMHNYHDTYKAFPAGYSADEEGKPLLSWRVHILPFVEQAELYEQFHLDEPWDSEHNKRLIAKIPEVFRSPNSEAEQGMTNYVGVSGEDGVFVRPQAGDKLGTGMREITDGTSNTIMTVEVPDESAVIWTKPADFAPDPQEPTKGLLGLRPGGFLAGLADGSIRFIGEHSDAETLKAMFTKAGGEVVQLR